MTLEQCKKLRKGDNVLVHTEGCCYLVATFERMVEVTHYPAITFEDIKGFKLQGGRKVQEVGVTWIDERGFTQRDSFNPRRVSTY